jgi:zinc protease
MKKILTLSILYALVLGTLVFSQKDPRQLKFPDIEFKPLKPQSVVIAPGIRLYFKENAELPAISGSIIFKNGSLADPAGKTGLASLTMELLKSGGTTSLTPEALEERIDFLGSYIYTYAADETSEINFWTLSKNFTETWKLVTDMIQNPRFSPARIDVEKKKELEQILRRWDYPTYIGFLLYRSLLYGEDFPEARRTTKESIEAITAEDLRNFYETQYKDREIIITLTGDFREKTTIDMVKKSLKSWKGLPCTKPQIPPVEMKAKPGIYLIDKPDMTQAVICLGHLGVNRLDPDNVELTVMNFILGSGGFSSRIMREVRSNRGLAYAAFGRLGTGRDKGLFFNFCQTKNQSAGEAIQVIKDIIRDLTLNPVTPEELETAIKYEQNSFIHQFDSARAVIERTIYLDLEGYPEDYLETYIPRIKKVDIPKVLQMAQRTLNPDHLVILVVGKKAELLDQLKALNVGEVTEIPLPKG